MSRRSSEAHLRQKRQAVRSQPCPKCGAKSGQKCLRVNGDLRFASHRERWASYTNAKGRKIGRRSADILSVTS